MSTQIDLLKDAVKLKEQHPSLDIHICADCSTLLDEFSWVDHMITKVEINPWYLDDEKVLTDDNDILELFMELDFCDLPEDEAKAAADKKYAKEVKQAICIYTSAQTKKIISNERLCYA